MGAAAHQHVLAVVDGVGEIVVREAVGAPPEERPPLQQQRFLACLGCPHCGGDSREASSDDGKRSVHRLIQFRAAIYTFRVVGTETRSFRTGNPRTSILLKRSA